MPSTGPLPLSGLRILDLTTVIYGPYTTQLLGDFGAEVIKVEAPEGDITRAIGPARSAGMGAVFMGSNRNKRSIVLDLKTELARDALWRLIDTADAFVHNIRPQKIASLGFDPDAVLARNPKIVYGALHGYREDGPYGGRPAYDDVIQGQSGIAGSFIPRDGAPMLIPAVIADKTAGVLAASGILAGMVQRLRTGKGVYVETAMFEGMTAYTLIEHQYGAIFVPPETGPGYPRALTRGRRPHPTADGYICVLAYTDAQWRRFWALIGRPELAEDPRYKVNTDRIANREEIEGITEAWTLSMAREEVVAACDRFEVPCAPILSIADICAHPQFQAREMFVALQDELAGEVVLPAVVPKLSRTPGQVKSLGPDMGQDNLAVYRDLLGLSEDEIADLGARSVI